MKKITLAISFLVITALVFAGSNEQKVMTPEKKLDASIQAQIAFPKFLQEQEGEHVAEMHFKVNPDGSIAVKDIVTDDQDLRFDLINQIKTVHVNAQGLDPNDSYKVVFRFNITAE